MIPTGTRIWIAASVADLRAVFLLLEAARKQTNISPICLAFLALIAPVEYEPRVAPGVATGAIDPSGRMFVHQPSSDKEDYTVSTSE